MSDYMFMLESRLSGEQNRALAAVQAAAAHAGANLFLTGGAVRDLLGHFPIRDLDFTVEGPALRIARDLEKKSGARITAEDEVRKSAELEFPGGVTVEISLSRQEKYSKTGAKPQVTSAPIHEDLRRRDFTINALALSLNPASKGLLLDPTNGLADLERREIRSVSSYIFYDDPVRILRLIRFQIRFGLTLDERTANQLENARLAEVPAMITAPAKRLELLALAQEPQAAAVLEALDQRQLATLFAPALTGPKLNAAGFAKLEKARQMLPFGVDFHTDHLSIFLAVLTEKLTAKESAQLVKQSGLVRSDTDRWQKLDAKSKAFEKALKSPKLKKPSQVYVAAAVAPGEQVLYLLMRSTQRLVLDRLKNHLQRYALTAAEVTDAEVETETGFKAGTPKFAKAKSELIAKRLDARPKKVAVEAEAQAPAPPPPPTDARGGGWRSRSR